MDERQISESSVLGVVRVRIGAGLINVGNTCFLNAVLQCLTYTLPLLRKLRASNHYFTCSAEFCALCALRHHIENSIRLQGYAFRPKNFIENLSEILSGSVLGEQEDAHEFLQCLLNKVDSCCIGQGPEDTESIITGVFGGRTRSRVSFMTTRPFLWLRCSVCSHVSDTFESLLDLSLEIDGMSSLTEALESYTKAEILEPSVCDGCHAEVLKEKQLTLVQAPQVVVLHLKRFSIDGAGVQKIHNFVSFPLVLDLQPFLSFPQDEELNYQLYAIVVHEGDLDRGHYFSIIRSCQSTWHKMNDNIFTTWSEEEALGVAAYMLFYVKQGSSPWHSSFMGSPIACQTIGESSSSSSSSSIDSLKRRENQSPGTDDTPESVTAKVEGGSSSTPLGPCCTQQGINVGAGKKAPLDTHYLAEDDKEDHRSPEHHVRSTDGESTAEEATEDRMANEMMFMIRNSTPMKKQRFALLWDWDLNNIPSPSTTTPDEKPTGSQSLSPRSTQRHLSEDHPSDADQTP